MHASSSYFHRMYHISHPKYYFFFEIPYLLSPISFFCVLFLALMLLLLLLLSPILATNYTISANYTLNLVLQFHSYAGIYKLGFFVNGESPGPTIFANEGDWISVQVNNFLPVPITIHFHGILQQGTPWADGVPGITQYPIPTGSSYTHTFKVEQFGPAWYHAHFKGYASDGIYGPIYVKPAENRSRPYHLVTQADTELSLLLTLESSPITIFADDLFDDSLDGFYANMQRLQIEPVCTRGILVNGMGRIQCPDFSSFNSTNSWGCLVDDDSADIGLIDHCEPTDTEVYMMQTENRPWQYINVINAGGQYVKAFSIDAHELIVIAVDGVFVVPRKGEQLQIPPGSRVTILVRTNKGQGKYKIRFAAIKCTQIMEGFGVMSYDILNDQRETKGKNVPSNLLHDSSLVYQDIRGNLLNNATSIQLHTLVPYTEKLKHKGVSTHTFRLFMNRTGSITFSMFKNGALLPVEYETEEPILIKVMRNNRENTTASTSLHHDIKNGDIVDIVLDNFRKYHHPIHLHGHLFHLINYSDSNVFPYDNVDSAIRAGHIFDFDNAPCFDLVLIPPGGHAVIRFTANNPGVWLLHCHNLSHMLGGMGAVLFEALDDISQINQKE